MKSAQKPPNPTKNPFHWKHYEGEIILLNVRWYCSYGLSYRDLVEMMEERVFMANPAQS
jgi:transposase-like protein